MSPLPQPLERLDGTHVRFQGRKLVYFAGCDYFRLSLHARIHRALKTGLKKYGLSVSASRMTTGNHPLYETLEVRLADFFHVDSALLAPNGYAPNLMVAQALARQFSHALIDERAHPSLQDAAALLDCPIIRFKHCDPVDLRNHVRRLGSITPLILTDGLFSQDGAIAPIKEYLKVLPSGGMILLDDAHSAGILGENGRGAIEHAGVSRKRIIQTITLSKAFGVSGGAVLGPQKLKNSIVSKSRMFAGSTPLPLPLASAALESVEMMKSGGHLRQRLRENVFHLKSELRKAGFAVDESPSPIVSVAPRSPRELTALSRRLIESRIYPSFTHYPGGPKNGHFRFVISSEHTRKQLKKLSLALAS